jgi:hypothetical protein
MSSAGIQSTRGDLYQVLVALDFALFVLNNPEYEWIELDSVKWHVDDVVVGKADGTKICCQCKKNSTSHVAWTAATLAGELKKAAQLLEKEKAVEIRFYSRTAFGALSALREHLRIQPDELSYYDSLGIAHSNTDAALADVLRDTPTLSTYEFLSHTTFKCSDELDEMEEKLRERLGQLASNSDVAFAALKDAITNLWARTEQRALCVAKHVLTKSDLQQILAKSGAMLTPTVNQAEVRASFQSTSAIGRTWSREIAGHRIPNPIVPALLKAIDDGHKSILLTGMPGSGKTCAMLEVQEALEKQAQTRSDLIPLFIQSREFADFKNAAERQEQGLSANWVEHVARMADEAKIVVVIDSLDVLSIAREHNALKYFLAQIDRLLLIKNVTVITSCREFDRQYDTQIRGRKWDFETKCESLNWDETTRPLLLQLGIDTTTIDAVTQTLICNPRELSLFVELAQRQGSFNVVTSQALAQCYLEVVVRKDQRLGDDAIREIESIAQEMLRLRSLSIPRQRFSGSQDMERILRSCNVLQETQDGKLTFGHQTLLDVLVISGALRQGITLNQFIQNLPPVPFVRPSIRSFAAQLAADDRKKFRTQIRAVLFGNSAFHIRRLVAETFSEQKPVDDDWSLIRDLRKDHPSIFQIIYQQAHALEWHHFWLKYLVPILKTTRDTDALRIHANRVAYWVNQEPSSVSFFWKEILTTDWRNAEQIDFHIESYLADITGDHLHDFVELFELLLNMPYTRLGFLGTAIANYVQHTNQGDHLLWRYITRGVTNDDLLGFQLDQKLGCAAHEFGSTHENFLTERMKISVQLLDLAVNSIEEWSRIRSKERGSYMTGSMGFLSDSSYDIKHSDREMHHVNNTNVLLDAIEAAVVHHAEKATAWWDVNCQRLCFNDEAVLRYFAILACTAAPASNVNYIAHILSDKSSLKSELSYELSCLLHVGFIYLGERDQDAIQSAILNLYDDEENTDERYTYWNTKERVGFISAIPCFLRSSGTQSLLAEYESIHGYVVRQPEVRGRGGMVGSPFSFEVFLTSSNNGVIRLLKHYDGYETGFDDMLHGGQRQVGTQLTHAASRDPERFIRLLREEWAELSKDFRDCILSGISNCLSYRHGNLQAPQEWAPLAYVNGSSLAQEVLLELERHPNHWFLNRTVSNALQACAGVIETNEDAERLIRLALEFVDVEEESSIINDKNDLLRSGINMMCGHVIDALMNLASRFADDQITYPNSLAATLRRFANKGRPEIAAVMLLRLAYLQYKNPLLGWELFDEVMSKDSAGLWKYAESCLYHAYHDHFEKVAPYLAKLKTRGQKNELKTWGRISALAAMSGGVDFDELLKELKDMDTSEAWEGAIDVWTVPANIEACREKCLDGIINALKHSQTGAMQVVRHMNKLFREECVSTSLPIELISLYFKALAQEEDIKQHDLFGFDGWLKLTAQFDPDLATKATENYVDYLHKFKTRYVHDYDNNLSQLLKCLFGEAEEREEFDNGEMLNRVVALQDAFISFNLTGVINWLKAAERQ